MTPVEIRVALHYYIYPDQMEEESDAVDMAHGNLVRWGLLSYYDGEGYEKTDKLEVYVQALRGVPLPVAKWVIPE